MVVTTVNGVLKHCSSTGNLIFVGYTTEAAVSGLTVSPVTVIDMEDSTSNRWVLAMPTSIGLLDTAELDTLRDGEARRVALAKLTDAEVALLALTRE